MFLFGHIGITLGAAILITGIITTSRRSRSQPKRSLQPDPESGEMLSKSLKTFPLIKWTTSLGNFLDLRLLIIGSLLPDIIDKPLGMLLFGDGRIFTHSLLVTLLLLIIGGYLALNYKQTGVLAIGFGTAMHLVLDRMWLTPNILFWPSLGWRFPVGTRESYLPIWMNTLVHNPYVDISETIGLLIVLGFVWILISRGRLRAFLLRGIVD